jgi:hypothetical protein
MSETRNNFDLAIVTGFGDKGVRELGQMLIEKLQPRSYSPIQGCPWYKAMKHPHDLVTDVTRDISELYSNDLLLIGHSYGALLALGHAMRIRMKGVLGLILIDGPLNLDVPVQPAKPMHHWFWRQYRYRPDLADFCLRQLKQLDNKSNIAAIGNEHDAIVPFESKLLPDGHRIPVQKTLIHAAPDGKPYNWVLPDTIKGHGLHRKIDSITKIAEIMIQEARQNERNVRQG